MKRLYSVFDTKSKDFGPICCFGTPEAAIRWFKEAVENHKYICDLDLYNVGQFDEVTGEIYPNLEEKPNLVITGQSIFDEIMAKAEKNSVNVHNQKNIKEVKADEKAL